MAKRKSGENEKLQNHSHQPFDYNLLVGRKILGHLRDLPNNKTKKEILLYKEDLEIDSRLQGYFRIDFRKIKSYWVVLELEKIPSGKKRRRDLYPLRIKQNSIIPVNEVIKPENLSNEIWSRLPEWLGSSFDKLFAYKEQWFVLHDHLDTLQDQIQRKWQEELEQQSQQKDSPILEVGKKPEERVEQGDDVEALSSLIEHVELARLQQKQKELEEEYDRLFHFQAVLEQEREELKRKQEEFEEQKQKMIARLESEFVSFDQLRKGLKLKQQEYDDERRDLEKKQSDQQQAIEALKRKQERFTQWESAREKSLTQQREDLKRQQEALDSKQKSLEKEQSEQRQAQEDLERSREELEKEQSEQQRSLTQQQEDLERQQKALDSERRNLEKEQSDQQRSLAQQLQILEHQKQKFDSERRNLKKMVTFQEQADSAIKEKQEKLAQWEEELEHKESEFEKREAQWEEEFEKKEVLLENDEFKLTEKEKQLKELSSLLEQEQVEFREYEEESTAKARQQQKELDLKRQLLQLKERQLSERSDQLRMLQIRWGLSVESDETTVEDSLEHFRNEQELINHVQGYIQSQGFHFSEEVLINFYTCLKTNALVILAGLSGTGKSSLVRLFAEAIDAIFLPLSVKATWQDDADLLGFYHPEKKSYIPTPFLDFLVQAEANPDRLFIICLDEMNLSRVESYFSEFLSVLQQNKEHRKLRLYSKYEWDSRWRQIKNKRPPIDEKEAEIYSLDEQEHNLRRYPYEIAIPQNLFFCGTINVDETTYPFSDKVLDRAQIINFTDVIFYKVRQLQGGQSAKKRLSWEMFQQFCHLDTEIEPEVNNQWFNQLNQILRKAGFHFGYRVKRQIELYCAQQSKLRYKHNYQKRTVDLQVTQKILPKIKGIKTPRVKNMLHNLRLFCHKEGLHQATQQIEKMEQMEAINYWEIFRYVD